MFVQYWDYKFRYVSHNASSSNSSSLSSLQVLFMPSYNIASNGAGFLFMFAASALVTR